VLAESTASKDEEEDAEEALLEELSHAQHVITVDNFLPEAQMLRDVFDKRFDNPRDVAPERFMWYVSLR
jgi:hypothetical protein